jgi:hypothetical protein
MENDSLVIEINDINDMCCICLSTDPIEKIKLSCCRNELHMSCLETFVQHAIKKYKSGNGYNSSEIISIPIECPLCRKCFVHAKLKPSKTDARQLQIMAKLLTLLLAVTVIAPFCYWIITAIISESN